MSIYQWKYQLCTCGHPRWDHDDEHSEVPTGTGHCTTLGCTCYNFTRPTVTHPNRQQGKTQAMIEETIEAIKRGEERIIVYAKTFALIDASIRPRLTNAMKEHGLPIELKHRYHIQSGPSKILLTTPEFAKQHELRRGGPNSSEFYDNSLQPS